MNKLFAYENEPDSQRRRRRPEDLVAQSIVSDHHCLTFAKLLAVHIDVTDNNDA